MRSFFITMLAVILCCSSALAVTSTGKRLGQFGLGTLGGLAGAVVAITAIAEITPQIESRLGKTAVVVGSLTLFDGVGAAAGVLAGGRIWDIEGNVGGSILGGLAGGLASAFTEPLLYLLGIPEGWTEFFGLALLPILPALGAMLGFGR
ncbi:hypothetical protein KAT84_01590 [Candidatus Bipolaricaulota bacterium]|nr:hypothetical protein [Candidatus Bipolaricaulota bacterium]